MNRMLFPALILAGPAMAHSDTQVHAHGSDYAALAAGLALIAVIAITVILKLPK
ncbi:MULTISPECIES: hypothetical protein [Ruegeria]|uniref:Uncharacterized protein n=1 Tax=Ruegeria atlantica TaxID=81569 RepID=A0A0P1E4Z2_9RHOB|nr:MULTISPECIES: hypothetical protein [Ruegeria]CUH42357.1 hypothetical protein RUM4293_01245 [Ruegeria atlantica]